MAEHREHLGRLAELIRKSANPRDAADWAAAVLVLVRVAAEMEPMTAEFEAIREAYGSAPPRLLDRMLRQAAGRLYYASDPAAIARVLDRFASGDAQARLAPIVDTLAPPLRPLVELAGDARVSTEWRAEAVETIRGLGPAAIAAAVFGRLLSALARQGYSQQGYTADVDPRLLPVIAALAARGASPDALVFDPLCGAGDAVTAVADAIGSGLTRAICVEADPRLSAAAAGRFALASIDTTLTVPSDLLPRLQPDVVVNNPWLWGLGPRRPDELLDRVERGDVRALAAIHPTFAAAAALMSPGGTRAVFVLPPLGPLSAPLLRWLADRRWLEAFIALPAIWIPKRDPSAFLLVCDSRRLHQRVSVIDGTRLSEVDDWAAWLIERLDARSDDRVCSVAAGDFEPRRPLASYFYRQADPGDAAETASAVRGLARDIADRLADPRLSPALAAWQSAQGGEMVPLSELATVIRSPWPGRKDPAQTIEVTVVRANGETRRRVDAEAAARYALRPGDIVISQPPRPDEPPPIRVWDRDEPAVASNHSVAVRSPEHGRWLALYLRSQHAIEQLVMRYRGSHRTALPIRAVRALPVPMPPADTGAALVDDLEAALGKIDHVQGELDRLQASLDRHARALLATVFPHQKPSPDDPEP